jgi:hypothetical protein
MLIDCTKCEMYKTDHCKDCLVTALLHPPEDRLEITDDLDPPLQALAEVGLIPVLKFRPRTEGDQGEAKRGLSA